MRCGRKLEELQTEMMGGKKVQQQQRMGAVLDAYSTLATGLNTRAKTRGLAKQSFQRKILHNV